MQPTTSGLLKGHDAFRAVHLASLGLSAVFLPWSTAFLSIAQLLMMGNWLLEGLVRKDLGGRFHRAFWRPAPLIFISFFLLHVLGLLWTSDLGWGIDLVRILLPVLSFGVALGAGPRLSRGAYRAVLLLGAWSAVVSTMACLLLHTGDGSNYRSLSLFISHIRLSLLLCLAIVVFLMDRSSSLLFRIACWLGVLWSVLFLARLSSLQGFIILLVLGAVFLWRAVAPRRAAIKFSVRTMLVVSPLIAAFWVANEVRERHRFPDVAIAGRTEWTVGGERYTHDMANPQMENGVHVWTYVAWGEVRRTWSRRSTRSVDEPDDKGFGIYSTLFRYLSSKGLRKDSVSIMSLTDEEIRAIEAGRTTAKNARRDPIRERLAEVFFELEHYHTYGVASGHSVAMRLEFLKAGWSIARAHWPVGVGTGDTQQAFDTYYARSKNGLGKEWHLRAHNEYLTLLITFGLGGLLWALFSWWWPAYRLKAWSRPHFIAWALIFGISCLVEDTIETQAGATFFALYYALFVFASPASDDEDARPDAIP